MKSLHAIFKRGITTSSLTLSLLIINLVILVLGPANILGETHSTFQGQDQPETTPLPKEEKGGIGDNITNNTIINLSNNTGRSSFLKPLASSSNNCFMAASGDNVYVVWTDNSTGSIGSVDIMLARSEDKGTTFDKPIDLSFPLRNNGSTFGISHSPQIAVAGNNVYVVWIEFSYAPSQMNFDTVVLYSRSNNGGKTFEGPFNITGGCFGVPEPGSGCLPILMFDPRIIASEDSAYVTWTSSILRPALVSLPETPSDRINMGEAMPSEIFLSRIDQRGSTEPLNISNSTGESDSARVALSGSNVYVAWRDEAYGYNEILLKRIPLNGSASESKTINISNNPLSDSQPELVADRNNVYIIWQVTGRDSNGLNKSAIEFVSSRNNGTTFTDPVSIAMTTAPPQLGAWPSITVSNDGSNGDSNKSSGLYGVWTDGAVQNQKVYFSRINGTGASVAPQPYQVLTNSTHAMPFVHVAVSTNGVHIVWAESTLHGTSILFTEANFTSAAATTNDDELGQHKSMPFFAPINVGNSTGSFPNPQIAATANNVYLTWEGENNGASDIYFKRIH
jgi:hypothetical protein